MISLKWFLQVSERNDCIRPKCPLKKQMTQFVLHAAPEVLSFNIVWDSEQQSKSTLLHFYMLLPNLFKLSEFYTIDPEL